MLDGAFVIDAVSHGYNMNPEIAVPPPMGPNWTAEFVPQAYRLFHASQSEGAVLDYERWTRGVESGAARPRAVRCHICREEAVPCFRTTSAKDA